MRIQSGAVAMQSERNYHAVEEKTKSVMTSTPGNAVILTVSSSSRELLEQSHENYFGSNILSDTEDKQEENSLEEDTKEKQHNRVTFVGTGVNSLSNGIKINSLYEMKLQMLEGLLRSLGLKCDSGNSYSNLWDLISKRASGEGAGTQEQNGAGRTGIFSEPDSNTNNKADNKVNKMSGNRAVWRRTTVESAFMKETENTAFSSTGIVKTSDGREIAFNIDVEMSREFMSAYENVTTEDIVMTDPLVINLDTDCVKVTDQKFLFDIDADGTKEEISFTEKGSGFLALDKNGDGVINDGNELFGTKSGDGFKDLSAYDTDGNGWIDENDDIFNKLRIWTKDEDGNDMLLDLKKANVGAIYLGSVGTEFSLNDDATNETNAVIRKTGIYLKETGEVGTVQHVDFAI